jgi:murein peptide amidase A
MARVIAIRRYTEIVRRIDALRSGGRTNVVVLDVLRRAGYALPFFELTAGPSDGPQLALSAGVHGDEPAGIEALLAFFERPALPAIGVTAFPCLNPTGFIAGTRRNDIGLDLNRTWGQEIGPQEIELVRAALAGRRFDSGVDLHEDIEARGFYLYEHVRGNRQALGPRIVAAVRAAGMPINDAASIEGRALVNGSVEPAEETLSPLVGFYSIYLFDRHCDHTLVPESPGLLPLPARVAMHLTAIDTVIDSLA